MTSTAVQPISIEDAKQAIIALIKENNADFRQFLVEIMTQVAPSSPKKAKKKHVPQNSSPVNAEHIPYSEMPFWKANPHLKPLDPKDSGAEPLSKDFFDALLAFGNDPELRLTDEMIENID